jgi:hypothetical protein
VQRDRWYALQTGASPVAAIVAILLGGILGQTSYFISKL